jgi:predicted nucleic acid-binding protein
MLVGRYAAVLDACVLNPPTMRHALLWLARQRLFRPLWSAQILDEWEKSVKKRWPNIPPEKLRLYRGHFAKFEEAMVEEHQIDLAGLKLPDPNDGHVIVTAVCAKADAIITTNLKHFPKSELDKLGIEAIHPDTFLVNLIDLDEAEAIAALRLQRQNMTETNPGVDDFLAAFDKCKLPQTTARLKSVQTLL